jgi:hypothetical protein
MRYSVSWGILSGGQVTVRAMWFDDMRAAVKMYARLKVGESGARRMGLHIQHWASQ